MNLKSRVKSAVNDTNYRKLELVGSSAHKILIPLISSADKLFFIKIAYPVLVLFLNLDLIIYPVNFPS
jgi:hypothetical protein